MDPLRDSVERPDRLRLGAMFPGDETGLLTRPELDLWLDAVRRAGLDDIAAGDHVLGVDDSRLDPAVRESWAARWSGPPGSHPYTHRTVFREPFTLFAYLAGLCDV